MIGGGLTNSGTMPINGGASGDIKATNRNEFGGIQQGSINMGGGLSQMLPVLIALAVIGYVVVKK